MAGSLTGAGSPLAMPGLVGEELGAGPTDAPPPTDGEEPAPVEGLAEGLVEAPADGLAEAGAVLIEALAPVEPPPEPHALTAPAASSSPATAAIRRLRVVLAPGACPATAVFWFMV
ncbi:hypothetical protein GCM10009760_60410 [Kitasatospora kazusensis]|uniref:Uncharacterized protein n=1 Tax=Kitasatospora kazusensis TaxID=407974 RepID=A0ABN3AAN5_9ACTN